MTTTTKQPTEWTQGPKTFQFELAQASVIYTERKNAAGTKVLPKLAVQCIDVYRYQREWTLELDADGEWVSHAYRHPGIREIQKVPAPNAKRLLLRFLTLCAEHPSLLFNAPDHRPRAEGFVHLHTQLLDGAAPSVKLLD